MNNLWPVNAKRRIKTFGVSIIIISQGANIISRRMQELTIWIKGNYRYLISSLLMGQTSIKD